jgi:DNA-binding NarL/FixJ family response regulator
MKKKDHPENDLQMRSIGIPSEMREPRLTNREAEVLKLLAMGYNNPQIAEKLFISRFTVEQHRKNIIKKLGATNFVQLILYAQKVGLI